MSTQLTPWPSAANFKARSSEGERVAFLGFCAASRAGLHSLVCANLGQDWWADTGVPPVTRIARASSALCRCITPRSPEKTLAGSVVDISLASSTTLSRVQARL